MMTFPGYTFGSVDTVWYLSLFVARTLVNYLLVFEAHGSAAFLAWHRYFIHTYEQALSRQCNYQGVLT